MAAAISAVFAAACLPARAEPPRAADGDLRSNYSYYVEFRAAENGVYGHSYIAYGQLNRLGQPATAHYADIHPTGDFASMVLGHFIPMNAATRPNRDTLRRKITSSFRRPLTAGEYRHLTAAVARTRAAGHAWSILVYNCNDFVADVAQSIGMQTPSTLAFPSDFIPRLRMMNQPTRTITVHHRAPPHGQQAALVR